MGRSLSQLVADVQQGQQQFAERQARLTEGVNTALAGGLDGIGQIADGLSQLRERQPPAVSPFLPNRVTPKAPSALQVGLANIAQAQLDATQRNQRITDAVNTAVMGGTGALAGVASGLNQLRRTPQVPSPTELNARIRESLEVVERYKVEATTAAWTNTTWPPAASPARQDVCPTCLGRGYVVR